MNNNSFSVKKLLHNPIFSGTIILTAAGIINRFLGFYYRIYLTHQIGAQGLGLYQMIIPLSGICMAVASSGISVAISRTTARLFACNKKKEAKSFLILATLVSTIIGLMCSLVLWIFSEYFSFVILDDIRCINLIRVLGLSIPIAAIHSCIVSYYLGRKNAIFPAISQLTEQIVRIGSVFLMVAINNSKGVEITALHAIWGLLFGEAASCLLSLTCCNLVIKDFDKTKLKSHLMIISNISIPLTINRLVVNVFHSMEAILIPLLLVIYGLSKPESLETYGILAGMALPLIMLPGTIVNSFSSMLLPAVSEAAEKKLAPNKNFILSGKVNAAYECSFIIGIFFLGIFCIWGNEISSILFGEPVVGTYVALLAWLCPFMYIITTLASILNGLGKTTTTLLISTSTLIIRIVIIIICIPVFGITGYFISLLISTITNAIMCSLCINKCCGIKIKPIKWIVIPSLCLLIAIGGASFVGTMALAVLPMIPNLILLLFKCLCALFIFLLLIYATK